MKQLPDDYMRKNVTHGEQINYVWITLKELVIMQWEYIRKEGLWRSY